MSETASKKAIRMPNLEEYKLFVEDTARFTDRRQSITNLYITILALF